MVCVVHSVHFRCRGHGPPIPPGDYHGFKRTPCKNVRPHYVYIKRLVIVSDSRVSAVIDDGPKTKTVLNTGRARALRTPCCAPVKERLPAQRVSGLNAPGNNATGQ